MCIKIVVSKKEVKYDVKRPLEEQIVGSSQIVINYEPKDPSIDKFLDEVDRLCKNGISAKLNIKINTNSHILGMKSKKEIFKIAKDIEINEVIKIMTTMQAEADKKLEEMVNYCTGGVCRE